MSKENGIEVYEDVPKEVAEKVIDGNIKTLWAIFSGLEGNDEFMQLKNRVKNGIGLKVDIRFLIKGLYTEYPDAHKAMIRGYNKINLEELWDEIELREKEMRKVFMGMLDTSMYE